VRSVSDTQKIHDLCKSEKRKAKYVTKAPEILLLKVAKRSDSELAGKVQRARKKARRSGIAAA
jgi:hypothetical protein